jgi:uncharacterized protein YqgC (DUF456 family)
MDASLSLAHGLAIVLLAAALLGGLLLVPIGLPGLWIMLGAGLLYWILLPAGGIGVVSFLIASALVVIAEVLEFTIAGRYTRQYGGSRRASWGAIIGGIVGAVVGVPVPILGSLVGALIGSFAGAFVGELTVHRDTRNNPTRAATGALLGRAVAAATKSAIGVGVGLVLLGSALLGGLAG